MTQVGCSGCSVFDYGGIVKSGMFINIATKGVTIVTGLMERLYHHQCTGGGNGCGDQNNINNHVWHTLLIGSALELWNYM